MRKCWTGMITMLLLACPVQAGFVLFSSLPKIAESTDQVMTAVGGTATAMVDSTVYQLDDYYIYCYQVHRGSVGIRSLFVPIEDLAEVVGWGTGTPMDGKMVTMDYDGGFHFLPTELGAGQASTYFFFYSTQGPAEVEITGLTSNLQLLKGFIYAPVPEPSTMVLLTLGSGLLIRRKKN